ncbi:unnamed protein product [Lathyrus oleraceus]
MWIVSNRKLLFFSVVVFMVVIMSVYCQVGAIRVVAKVKFSHGIVDNKGKEDLFHKYFSGRTSNKQFDESKRKVPSCPDPLHN